MTGRPDHWVQPGAGLLGRAMNACKIANAWLSKATRLTRGTATNRAESARAESAQGRQRSFRWSRQRIQPEPVSVHFAAWCNADAAQELATPQLGEAAGNLAVEGWTDSRMYINPVSVLPEEERSLPPSRAARSVYSWESPGRGDDVRRLQRLREDISPERFHQVRDLARGIREADSTAETHRTAVSAPVGAQVACTNDAFSGEWRYDTGNDEYIIRLGAGTITSVRSDSTVREALSAVSSGTSLRVPGQISRQTSSSPAFTPHFGLHSASRASTRTASSRPSLGS